MGSRGGDVDQAGPTCTVWWLRIRRDILTVEAPPEEQEVPASHQGPHPGALMWEEEPHNSCLWKPVRTVSKKDKGLVETEVLLLKKLHTDSFTNSLALSSSPGPATQTE